MKDFAIGDRVRTVGHYEWPDGTAGTIAPPQEVNLGLAKPGEWQGHRRTVQGRVRPILFYFVVFVVFDQPTDDGSGDGPYYAAEVDADYLEGLEA